MLKQKGWLLATLSYLGSSMKWLYVASASLLLLAWLAPDHYHPWSSFYNDFIAFTALLMLFIGEIKEEKKVSPFSIAICFAILWILLQIWMGTYYFMSDAVMAVLYLAGCLISYQAGLSTPRHKDIVVGLAFVILAGSVVSAIVGLYQWLEISSFWVFSVGDDRPSANLGQANNFATLLFWGLCAASYLFVVKLISAPFFVLLTTMVAWGVAISESRTPVLQALFYFGWVLCLATQTRLRRAYLLLLPILVLATFYVIFPSVNAALGLDKLGATRIIEGDYNARFQIWQNAIHAISNSSWLGYGWGQGSIAQFGNLLPGAAGVEFVEHHHNIVLDLLIWNGPIMGALLVGFAAFWVGRQFLQPVCAESWFLLACIGGLAIHACLEYPMEYAYFLLPVALMVGLVDNLQRRGWPIAAPKSYQNAAVLLPFVFFMLLIWREYKVLEDDHRLMRAQNFGLPVDKSSVLSHDVFLIDGEREFIRFARTKATAGMSTEQLEWMRRVTYRYPLAVTIYRYGTALALNGQPALAHLEMKKIETLYGVQQYLYYKYYWEQSIRIGKEA